MGADADMRLKRAQASKAQKGKIRRDTRAKEAQLVKHGEQYLRARIQETPEHMEHAEAGKMQGTLLTANTRA